MADLLMDGDSTNSIDRTVTPRMSVEVKEVKRTSSFQDRIHMNGSMTPAERELDSILSDRSQTLTKRTNGAGRRSDSPLKAYSPSRDVSPSRSPRRERSFLRSTSPDKLPWRQSAIWSQWENSKRDGEKCLQEFNVKQMESLYGKQLRGKVDVASEWYRANGLDRSKTQMEALDWLYKTSSPTGPPPMAATPRGTQTEPLSVSPTRTPGTQHMRFVGSPYKNTEMKTREKLKEEKNMNKLSTRHRVMRTPNAQDIRAREKDFTNDAVVTERRRTRFKDIIPQYDASIDRHCKAYFKRRDVQDLITVTRSREENKMRHYWLRKIEIGQRYTVTGHDDGISRVAM